MKFRRTIAAAAGLSAAVGLALAPPSMAESGTITGPETAIGIGASYQAWNAAHCDPNDTAAKNLNGVDGRFIDVSAYAPRGNVIVNWSAAARGTNSAGLGVEFRTASCFATGGALQPATQYGDWTVPVPGNAKWMFLHPVQLAQVSYSTR